MEHLYLFTGEPFLRQRAIKQLIRDIKASARLRLSEVNLDAEELSLTKLSEELRTSPLFEDGKILLIRRADVLADNDKPASFLTQGLPENFYVILEAAKLSRRSALYKAVEERGQAQDFSMDRRNLPSAVKELLQERGIQLTPEALRYLLEAVEPDLLRIYGEIEKLARYPHKGALDVGEIKELVFSDRGGNIFEFLDTLSERDLRALKLLKGLLNAKEDPNKIFFMIASQIRSLIAVKSLAEDGLSSEEIARKTGQYAWLVGKKRKQAHHFSTRELIELLQLLQREDSAIKRGERQPQEALLFFIGHVCTSSLRLPQKFAAPATPDD